MTMPTSSTPKQCQKCGAALPGTTAGELCAACMLGFGLDLGDSDPREDAEPAPRSTFGDYELLGEIAHGGMGVVFRARQRSLGRIVALKTILAGRLARPEDVARFRLEAEAAANLKHPNIVAIHEVGECDGQHFFSMDYIEGGSLSALLRDGPLPATQAARYVETIARAVHYAHEQGVLHRDLKPSNILLDARDEPHITDFGLAKRLTDSQLAAQEGSQLTLSGQVLGTPSFMPPEQAAGQRDQMGPRSDVYSLGAILYHLLTGRPPFVGADVHSVLAQVLGSEVLTPRLLNPAAPRDLETIALKCLEKDPSRRYASALALAEDLARHLRHEPIHAVPPSTIYRARKFVRRHRVGVTVAACFAVVLITATVVSNVFRFRAERDKARAWKAEGQAEAKAAEAKANAERAKESEAESATVLAFLNDKILSTTRPEGEGGGLGREVTVRRAVESADAQVTLMFSNQPNVEMRIRDTLGGTYLYLGDFSNSVRQFERVLTLATQLRGTHHVTTFAAMDSLGKAYRGAGRWSEAVPLLEALLERSRETLGPRAPDTITAMISLAGVYRGDSAARRQSETIALYTNALALCLSTFGPDDRRTMNCMNGLALTYQKIGNETNAIPLLEKVEAYNKANDGQEAMETLASMQNLAAAYQSVRRLDDAYPRYTNVLGIQQIKLGPDHPHTLVTLNNLASWYRAAGQADEAVRRYEELVPMVQERLGMEHIKTQEFMNNLASAYGDAGRWSNAVSVQEELLQLVRQQYGSNHWATLKMLGTLAETCGKASQFEKANALRRELWTHLQSTIDRAQDLLATNQFIEAEAVLKPTLLVCEYAWPTGGMTLICQSLMGGALLGQKRFPESESLLRKALEELAKMDFEQMPPREARSLKRLRKDTARRIVQLYGDWGKADEAAKWRTRFPDHFSQ